jgi:4-amino-4-deoxy-L-arabinose transferase-like glycosyltransferase
VSEREWREASDMRVSKGTLAAVLGTAAILRFWSLGFGIPYAVGVDEPEIMERVVNMMKTGDFNPHFFDYPTLFFYMQLPVAIARFLFGALSGSWHSLDQVSAAHFYLWARALTAAIGTATVFLLFQIGLRWGARHALLGAGLLAVLPMHVRESHFVLTDVPATFFATLTFLLSLVAHEKGTPKAFMWAGAAAGLTIATKYNAGIVLMMPLIAVWMTLDAQRFKCLLWLLGGCIGAFLIAAPYTILDLPGFLNGFAGLTTYYRTRGSDVEPGWVIYFKHLSTTMGWTATLLMIAGFILGIVRAVKGPGRVRWTLLVAFPFVYFVTVSGRALIYGRYLLPMLPFVCLLAAIAVVSGVSLLRRFDIPHTPRRLLITGLTIAALLQPLVNSIAFDRDISGTSTQQVAYRWILQNVPPGSRIAIEKHDIRLPIPALKSEHVLRLTDQDHAEYVRQGYQYLIASSQVFGPVFASPQHSADLYSKYRRLFDQSQEVFVVKPEGGRRGPELRIYKLQP